MKYLVTGAAGFLGYYIAKLLSERRDAHVYCVDNFVRGAPDRDYLCLLNRSNVTGLEIDLADQVAVSTLPHEIDIVFHMAALNGTQNFYERPFEVVRCCTLPTIFLIEHYGNAGGLARFIYAGTSEAYASTVTRFGWPVPTAEDVPLSIDDVSNPRWSYAASKMHGEIATVSGCRHYGMEFTIVRFHNAYGPRMGDKHVIPDFLSRAREGRFELFGHEDTRSFIYADDAAALTVMLAESEAGVGEIVNVGGDEEIMMRDLGERMMQVCGFEGQIVLHPSPAGSVRRRAPDLAKLRRLLGPYGQTGLNEGLRQTADYYLAPERCRVESAEDRGSELAGR